MSSSSASTAGKITLGGLALVLLSVAADISGLFSFTTGKSLNEVLDGGVRNSRDAQAASTSPSPMGTQRAVAPAVKPQGPAPAYLNDLEPVGGSSMFNEKGSLSIDGHSYPYAMSLATGTEGESEAVEYALGGKYSRLSLVLGLRDDALQSEGPSACHWRVLGDRKELKEGDTVRGRRIRANSLSIKGVVHLRIEVAQTKGMSNPVPWPCTIGDAKVS